MVSSMYLWQQRHGSTMLRRLLFDFLILVLIHWNVIDGFQPLLYHYHKQHYHQHRPLIREDDDGPAMGLLIPQQQQQDRRRPNTAISMGIRSMLGFGKSKGNKAEDDPPNEAKQVSTPPPATSSNNTVSSPAASSSSSPAASTKKPTSNLFSDKSVPLAPPLLRMGEDPTTKEVNVHSIDGQKESIQERINRVKSGRMTEDEKQAFLQTALTAGNTLDSRKPLVDNSGSAADGKKNKRFFASPFPSDSILRNFVRGGNNKDSSATDDNIMASQRKKQEYLDMVTNPDRFNRYTGSKGGTGKGLSPPPSNLGARLGAAAMADESQRQRNKKQFEKINDSSSFSSSSDNNSILDRQQDQQQRSLDQELKSYEQRAAELAQKRQAELQAAELQQQEKRRRNELAKQQQEMQKKQAEEERLEQLTKAQDEYWTQKLARERAAKEKRMQDEKEDEAGDKKEEKQKASAKDVPAVPGVGVESTIEEAVPSDGTSTAAPAAPAPSSGPVFNPDESDLLVMAEHDREEDWEHNQDIIDQQSSRLTGIPPMPAPHPTEMDFIAEQAERKRQIDEARELQLRRLKELNSPLPSRPAGSQPAPSPSPYRTHRPATRPAVSSSVNPVIGVQPQTATRSNNNGVIGQNAAAASSPSESSSSSPVETAGSPPSTNSQRQSNESRPNPMSPWANILGGLNGNKKTYSVTAAKSTTTTEVTTIQQEQEAPPPPPSASRPAPPYPAVRKGPIRMKIPQLDEEEDEDGVDVRADKKMSIADAMKRTTSSAGNNQADRSKKWGIDMSRFDA